MEYMINENKIYTIVKDRETFTTPCPCPALIQKVLSEGYQLFLFLVDEERRENLNNTSGPSSAHQRNAIQMAFHWRADDGPTLNAGLVVL